MKKLLKRSIALLLSAVIIFGAAFNCAAWSWVDFFLPASAGYGSDWRCWSQGSSEYSAMVSGCRVVSYSKLLAECGIVSPSSFNPDTLFEWGCNNGYWSQSSVSERGTAGVAPVNYAAGLGKTLVREGTAALSGTLQQQASIIMSYLNSGYYVIATCSEHYVYVGREASIAAGTPIVMNSGGRAADSASLIQQYISPPSGWAYNYTGIIYYSYAALPQAYSVIEFGSYPQGEVKDAALLASLNSLPLSLISYNYYSGNGNIGSMAQSDYMKYADVVFEGEKYRAVTFSRFRPKLTIGVNAASHPNLYATNTVYWFKFEPLLWMVIDEDSGLMLCESIIDSQAYNTAVYGVSPFYGNAGLSVYANNYAASSIRQWLNNDFYNTAFSAEEKLCVETATLENSALSAEYSSAVTNDKVFLPSNDEIPDVKCEQRSDYASAQGASASGEWLTGTAGSASDSVCIVDGGGSIVSALSYDTSIGIRPEIKLSSYPASSVAIDAEFKDMELAIGEKAVISFCASPSAARGYTAEYSCSDTSVAVVDSLTGAVTAVGEGDAVITVTIRNANLSAVTDTAKLHVKSPDAQSVLSFFTKLIALAGKLLLLLLDIFA